MAVNLSGVSPLSVLGKLLRLPLRLIPAQAKVRILQGPLRGKRWIVGSSLHGYWLGSYEYGKQRLFQRELKPGQVVYDIGAHVGFYTLLSATTVGAAGKVVAFEPLARNLNYLREHVRCNGLENVTIFAAAVGERSGEARFTDQTAPSMGHLTESGSVTVRVVGIDELVDSGQIPPPNLVKMDVEGAEAMVLRGAARVLTEHKPTLFVATHGKEVHAECCLLLESMGYRLQPIDQRPLADTDEFVARPA